MGFLSGLLAGPDSWLDSTGGIGSMLGIGSSGPMRLAANGIRITPESSLNYSAVWAASRVLTETAATLPRYLFRQAGKSKEPAIGHPLYRMFRREPNPEQGGVNFWTQQVNFLINWGTCFAEKVRDPYDRVSRLWPIHPSRIPPCNIKRDPDTNTIVFHVRNNDGSVTPIPIEDMFYVPGALSDNGITGRGVIPYGAESIGMGLATEQFGSAFFGNGAGPAIVMTHPKKLGEAAADNLRKSWWKRYPPGQPNKANGFLVLEEGTQIERLTIPPEAAQFLQTRQFNITEIARWYNLPVHLLREMSKSSFNNIESENLQFVIISLMPWLIRIEDELNRQLLHEDEKDTLYFKFMLQGLLRGDMAARSQFYKEMNAMGAYSINEIRELEDMNPVDGGDIRLVPLNMTTLDKVNAESADGAADPVPTDAAPASDATPSEPATIDIADSTEAAQTANIQATALNGAQITAMVDLIGQVAAGTLPPDSARAMLLAAFPLTDPALINTMVDDAAEFADENAPDDPAEDAVDPADQGESTLPGGDSTEEPADDSANAPAEDAAPAENNADLSAMRTAARTLFVDQFNRLARKEAKGILWAAEEPGKFLSRLDEFFDRHRKTYQEQIGGVIEAAAALGADVSAETFTQTHLETLYAAVVDLSGTATATTLGPVLTEWSTGYLSATEAVADQIFGTIEPKE